MQTGVSAIRMAFVLTILTLVLCSSSLSFRGVPRLRDDEESRMSTVRRARFLAEFTLSGQSEILRCAQDDSEGLGMTGWQDFSATCYAGLSHLSPADRNASANPVNSRNRRTKSPRCMASFSNWALNESELGASRGPKQP